jgi:hypothetical protein
MALTGTITGKGMLGSKRMTWGTYATTEKGDTIGNLDVGLKLCDFIALTPNNVDGGNWAEVAETLPYSGRAITIKVTEYSDGYWFAIGI